MQPLAQLPGKKRADDYPASLAATAEILSSDFDVVGTVADGQTLVSEANRLRPDLIVADVYMPISSGIEALHQLRESGSKKQECIHNDTRNHQGPRED